MKCRDRILGRCLDRIGHSDQSRRSAIGRNEHHGRSFVPVLSGRILERGGIRALQSHHRGISDRHAPAVDGSGDALAADRAEILNRPKRDSALPGATDDRVRQRVRTRFLERGGKSEQIGFFETGRRLHRYQGRFALGQGAGLVDDDRVDGCEALERRCILDQDAAPGPLADADHDRHRRGEPEGTGTGDDQHRHRRDQRKGQARGRPGEGPEDEGGDRRDEHDWNEHGRDLVDFSLNRRLASLRFGDHLNDPGEHRLRPDPLRFHHHYAVAVDRSAGDRIADIFLHGHRLPGEHGFVERGETLHYDPVDGNRLARLHPKAIPDSDQIQWDGSFAAGLDEMRRLRRQIEQRPDCRASLLPGSKLEHLPEQDQSDDHRRRLEVEADSAMHVAEGRRKDLRRDRSDHRISPGDAGADRDQGEHVEMTGDDASPAPDEEGPATPQDHRRGDDEFDPVERSCPDHLDRHRPEMAKHDEDRERRGQNRGHDEPAAHVEIFFRWTVAHGEGLGLQRHPADRTISGADLLDLGVHRAGVDDVLRQLRLDGRRRTQEDFRTRLEPLAAFGRAEMIILAGELRMMGGGPRIDFHAANGIDDRLRRSRTVMGRLMVIRTHDSLLHLPVTGRSSPHFALKAGRRQHATVPPIS